MNHAFEITGILIERLNQQQKKMHFYQKKMSSIIVFGTIFRVYEDNKN